MKKTLIFVTLTASILLISCKKKNESPFEASPIAKAIKLETQTIKNRDLKNRLSELRELRKLKNTRLSIL